MRMMRIATLPLLLGTAVAFSCGDDSITTQSDCGCTGPVSQNLAKEPGIIHYSGNDDDILRIIIKSGSNQFTNAVVLCNQDSLPIQFRKNNLKVKISGQLHNLCSDTGRMAGVPFTLTQIEEDRQ